MIRWLALLLMLASCNGCMTFDEMFYGDPRAVPQGAPNSCGAPPGIVNVAQTVEPPR